MTISLIIFSVIMILIGLFGAIVPFLPGLPLAFIGTLVLAIATHFGLISVPVVIALAFLALLSLVVDFASGLIGARLGKASIWGAIGAIVGTIVGILCFGILGIVFGPALGVLLFELLARRNNNSQAVKVAKTTLITSLLGLALNGILAVVYAIVVVVAVIF